MEQLTAEQWKERIIRGWQRWGNGEPLDPRVVDRLAVEFAKPLEIPMRSIADYYQDSLLYPDTVKMPQPRVPFAAYSGDV